VDWGGRAERPRLVALIIPTVEARGQDEDEDLIKPMIPGVYVDLGLKPMRWSGRVGLTERRLSLKPYWGKPTVRNFREGAGNVN
jgi:hypothetical protein